jgi:hypothetical protein
VKREQKIKRALRRSPRYALNGGSGRVNAAISGMKLLGVCLL